MSLMRPRLLVLSLLSAAVAVPPAAAGQSTEATTPLIRMRDGHGSDLLFRLNPRTLQQIGRPIRTFRGGSDLTLTADGSRLAFADPWNRGGRRDARIHFVDLARWKSMGVARVGRLGWFTIDWVSQDRVLAIAGEGRRQRLLWVDAESQRVVARRPFTGWVANSISVAGGVVLMLAPRQGVGPLRILLVDAHGAMRTIRIDGIEAGADYAERNGQVLTPAVTADPDGGRVYIVAARGLRVAEVDLASGAVSYHALGATASKGNIDVWWRYAVWAGDGRIAVTGDHWPPVRGRRRSNGPVPLGVRMIDTRSWTTTVLDPRPDSMHVAGGTVLAAGTRWFDGARRSVSTGLLAFDETGRRAFTRFRGRQVALLGSRGDLAYVWVRKTRTAHVLDLGSGRTLNSIRTGRRVPFLLSPP